MLGSAKRGIGKAIDWFSGDDKKEQPAASAKAAAEKSAAPNAKAAAETASSAKAPQMPDLPKGKSTSSTRPWLICQPQRFGSGLLQAEL